MYLKTFHIDTSTRRNNWYHGPNGAGKSSLIKSLIGEFNATGTKLLYNKPIQQQLQHITYIPQKAHIDLDFL